MRLKDAKEKNLSPVINQDSDHRKLDRFCVTVFCFVFFSFITAIELLGNPSEMYKFGTQFWTICFAILLVIPITTKFYLPIFMNLKLTSTFEVHTFLFYPKKLTSKS